jgi:hypothetical protein
MMSERGPDGTCTENMICAYPIYLEAVANEEKASDCTLTFRRYLPQEGWSSLSVRAADLFGQGGESFMCSKGVMIHEYTLFKKFVRVSADAWVRGSASNVLYTQYGWKDNDTTFLYGNKLYTAEGEVPVSVSKELETRNRWVGPGCMSPNDPTRGLACWRQAASSLFGRGCEGQACVLLAGFGSVFIRLLSGDEGGAVLAQVTQLSAMGKSTALAAVYSIWGGKHGLSLTNDDNRVAKSLTMGAIGNLPIVWDEIATKDPMILREQIMAFTNGRDKQRGNRDGKSVQHSNAWQLICITASNTSLVQALELADKSDAPKLRVMELSWDLPDSIDKHGDKLRQDMIANAGFAGEAFVRYLVKPGTHEWLVKTLAETQDEMWRRTGLGPEYRFWIRTMTCIAVAATIVHHLDLLEFDPDRIVNWLVDKVKDVASGEERSDEVDHLAEFINSQMQYLLLLSHRWTFGMAPIYPTFTPKEIRGTWFKKEQILLMQRETMMKYATANGIHYREWVKDLTTRGLLLGHKRYTLTAGCGLPSPQLYCHEINMNHPALSGVNETLEGNVITFPSSRQPE